MAGVASPASLRVAPCHTIGVWSQRNLPPQSPSILFNEHYKQIILFCKAHIAFLNNSIKARIAHSYTMLEPIEQGLHRRHILYRRQSWLELPFPKFRPLRVLSRLWGECKGVLRGFIKSGKTLALPSCKFLPGRRRKCPPQRC